MTKEDIINYQDSSGYVRFKFADRFLDLKTKYIRDRRWDIINRACEVLIGIDEGDICDIRIQKSFDPTEESIWPKENIDWSAPASAERSEV